jgi:hypothetical protein
LIPLQHPASLNVLQQYRQACAILKSSSRATRAAWYREALDLDFQFHITVDGASVRTFFYNRADNSWTPSFDVSEKTFLDSEKTLTLGKDLVKQVQGLKGRKHLGIVLHVADEFATAELKPKLDNPAALNDLRQIIYDNPREVLEDSSVSPEQASWRVMPYPASGSPVIATTINISRRLEPFLTTLRQLGNNINFPIITRAISAPLVAMMGLPSIVRTESQKPFVTVLQYPWFTAMAFFNEHLDLRLIRSIQHRGQRCPANFGSVLATTNVSLEFVNPDIYVLPLGEQVDTKISEDLKRYFPNSSIEIAHFPEVSPLPIWAPETILSVSDATDENAQIESHTFGVLRTEKWFTQDLLSPSTHEQTLFPSRKEIRLLRFFNIAKRVIFTAVVLLLVSMILNTYGLTTKPEWAFNQSEAMAVQQRMNKLGLEKAQLAYWNILLEDRSKAWASMELIAQLVPAKSGIMLRNFNHVIRPDAAPKQVKAGFVKEWKLTGLARNESIEYLNLISTRDGISDKFAEIAKITGDSSFDPTPTSRSLVVNIKRQENKSFKPRLAEEIHDSDPTTYSQMFELSIVQRFEATDDLAIPKAKAP